MRTFGSSTASRPPSGLTSTRPVSFFITRVVPGLTPLFKADPDIRFRAVAWLERIRRGGGLARIEARSRPVLTRRRWSSAGCSSVRAR